MGYYMRYIVSDDRSVDVGDIRTAFAGADRGYEIDGEDTECTIAYQGKPIGHVTVNVPGDGLFDEERDELIEFAEDGDGASGRDRVVKMLREARAIVAVQVLFGDGDTGRTSPAPPFLWTPLWENPRR